MQEQVEDAPKEKTARRTVVVDSEDDEEDMLFDAPSEPDIPFPAPECAEGNLSTQIPDPKSPPQDHPDESTGTTTNSAPEKISLILIDNLAHIVSPFLKKDEDQGSFS
jgi:hypothetical protein